MEEFENQFPATDIQQVEEKLYPQTQPNKKKYPWLTIFLTAAVLLLYALFFIYHLKKTPAPSIPEAALFQKKGGLTVAYVNSDSIKANYQLVHDLQQKLENKYSSLNKDISTRQSALEAKAGELQSKYESRQISLEEAQKMDEMLKMESKKLYDLNQEYTNRMSEEEIRLNNIYVDSINNFLARYNKKYNFDYILGYSKGGGILFARDTLDITKYVLEEINKEYYQKYPESKKNK